MNETKNAGYCLLAAFTNYWLYFVFWVQSELLTDDCMRPRCNMNHDFIH